MKKKIGILLAAMMVATCVLSGCSSENSAENSSVKIFYTLGSGGDYYEGRAAMVKDKAAELGVQLDMAFADGSIEIQDEQLKQAVAEGYDAIMCSAVSADTVKEMKEITGDIPIIFTDNAPDESLLEADKCIYVASDEIMAGEYQVEYVLEKLADKEEINAVLLMGTSGSSATYGRTKGVKRGFEISGKKVNYVFEDYADFSPDRAREFLELFLKTNPKVDCVICNNDDMAVGAIEAFENANIDTGNILFLGVDASAGGSQAIMDGKMAFTVFQSSKGQCEAAAEAAVRLAKGESIKEMDGATEDCKYVFIPFEKVDSSNVANYVSP